MLYIRKLFTQDLRDGKQIAFPKEPSLFFFAFDYPKGELDRQISFTFNAAFNEFIEYNGKVIKTRLYAAGSESRMDGEVKAFIRDVLQAKVDDLLIFKNKGNKHVEYEVMLLPQTNPCYSILLSLTNGENHTICKREETLRDVKDFPLQTIYYGAPGTGKSYKIKSEELQGVAEEYIFRTTFHPDYDYASFVGCYKPKKEDDKITYSFVPQVFTNAYIKAWNEMKNEEPKKVYLVIEEINRGNCAQIFGDLFQLLDRGDDGKSEYPVDADEDLKNYLLNAVDDKENPILDNKEGIKGDKLCLPPNLNILATMNTSDQSLFPMDSAFKRRWEWEYVPIRYVKTEEEKNDSKDIFDTFKITIGDNLYSWVEFLAKVNEKILAVTDSEDKQMGEYFIKKDIDEKTFINKVMYYLWSEVGKDLFNTTNAFFTLPQDFKDNEGKSKTEFSFNELFKGKATELLAGFMKKLQVKSEEEKAAEATKS